jgi:hypothetical protein
MVDCAFATTLGVAATAPVATDALMNPRRDSSPIAMQASLGKDFSIKSFAATIQVKMSVS